MAKRTREDFDQPSTAQSSPETSTPNTLLSAGSNQGEMIQETAKVIHLDNQSSESSSIVEVMTCSLPPHRQPLSFSSYEDYETHYSKEHVNRCIECRKNFPTPHFLDLHQEENHNPLIVILKERGERIVHITLPNFAMNLVLTDFRSIPVLLKTANANAPLRKNVACTW